MKKILFIIFFCVFYSLVFAQTQSNYFCDINNYSVGGNELTDNIGTVMLTLVDNSPVFMLALYKRGISDLNNRDNIYTLYFFDFRSSNAVREANGWSNGNVVIDLVNRPELRVELLQMLSFYIFRILDSSGNVQHFINVNVRPIEPAVTPTPTPAPVQPAPAAVSNELVRIQGGTFTMGSPANESGRRDNEGPQRQVTVSSFMMSRYEITQREYQEVMGTNPSSFTGDLNRPVERVSWFDAVEYCNRRSQREGLTPAYTISGSGNNRTVTWNRNTNGYRLPTEAEWEYACRAGTTTAYNTGANISNNTGWLSANSGGTTRPVGQLPANAWGLYDMHGNVWEWCWDWYGNYPAGAQSDPTGASSGSHRVIRGGSRLGSAADVRSAYRGNHIPTSPLTSIGFRVVRP